MATRFDSDALDTNALEHNALDSEVLEPNDVTSESTQTTAALSECRLTAPEFQMLAAVPPEVEWFTNLRNKNTKRAHRADVRDFTQLMRTRVPPDLMTEGTSRWSTQK